MRIDTLIFLLCCITAGVPCFAENPSARGSAHGGNIGHAAAPEKSLTDVKEQNIKDYWPESQPRLPRAKTAKEAAKALLPLKTTLPPIPLKPTNISSKFYSVKLSVRSATEAPVSVKTTRPPIPLKPTNITSKFPSFKPSVTAKRLTLPTSTEPIDDKSLKPRASKIPVPAKRFVHRVKAEDHPEPHSSESPVPAEGLTSPVATFEPRASKSPVPAKGSVPWEDIEVYPESHSSESPLSSLPVDQTSSDVESTDESHMSPASPESERGLKKYLRRAIKRLKRQAKKLRRKFEPMKKSDDSYAPKRQRSKLNGMKKINEQLRKMSEKLAVVKGKATHSRNAPESDFLEELNEVVLRKATHGHLHNRPRD